MRARVCVCVCPSATVPSASTSWLLAPMQQGPHICGAASSKVRG